MVSKCFILRFSFLFIYIDHSFWQIVKRLIFSAFIPFINGNSTKIDMMLYLILNYTNPNVYP